MPCNYFRYNRYWYPNRFPHRCDSHFPAASSSDVSVGWGTFHGPGICTYHLSVILTSQPVRLKEAMVPAPAHTPSENLGRSTHSTLEQCVLSHCVQWPWFSGDTGDTLDHHNPYNVHNLSMTTLKRMYVSFGSYSFQIFSDIYLIRYQSIWKVAGYAMLILFHKFYVAI